MEAFKITEDGLLGHVNLLTITLIFWMEKFYFVVGNKSGVFLNGKTIRTRLGHVLYSPLLKKKGRGYISVSNQHMDTNPSKTN
jgi:hypothetical protein